MARQGENRALQARSKQTRNKLTHAVEALLREKAFDDISVAEIAGRAGVSVGAVYRRFKNKDALIPVLFDAYKDRITAFAAEPENRFVPDPSAGLLANLHEMARLGWRFLESDGHLLRAASLYARTRPDLVGPEWDSLLEDTAQGYHTVLSMFADKIARPDLDEAARMTLYLLNVAIAEYGLYPTQGPGAVLRTSSEAFIDAIARAIYGYLTTP